MKPRMADLHPPGPADLCKGKKPPPKLSNLHRLMPAPIQVRSSLREVSSPVEIHLRRPFWITVLSNRCLLVGKPRQSELAP